MQKIFQPVQRFFGFLVDALGLFRAGLRITDKTIEYFEAWWRPSGYRVKNFIEESGYDRGRLDFTISRMLQKKGGIMPHAVSVSLESKGVIARIISVPHVPRAKLAASLVWEIKKYMPFDPKSVVIDHQVLGTIIEEGRTMWRVLLVAAKLPEVQQLMDVIQSFDIRVKAVRYVPLAFVNAFKKNPNDTSIAYVSFDENHVAISILEKDRLMFTNTSFLKGKKGLYRHVIDVLKKFIEQRISFLERVVLTPGYEDLAEIIMEELNIMVTIQDQADLVFPIDKADYEAGRAPLVYSLLRQEPVDINLVPRTVKQENRRMEFSRLGMVGVVVLFLIMLLFYFNMRAGINDFAMAANRQNPGNTDRRQGSKVDNLIRRLKWVEAFERDMTRMRKELNLLRSLQGKTSKWNRVLAGIAMIIEKRNLYGKLWLLRIKTTRKGRGYIEGVSFANQHITSFFSALENFTYLRLTEIEYTKPIRIRGRSCMHFKIRFRVAKQWT